MTRGARARAEDSLLLALAAGARDADAAWAGDGPALTRLLERARLQRVVPAAAAGLASMLTSVPREWRDAAARHAALRDELGALLRELGRTADEAGFPLGHWKGFAVDRWYPAGRHRQFNDLDLFVDRLDDLWPVGALLQGAGFDSTGLLLRRDPQDGSWSGLASFERAGLSEGGLRWRVDLVARAVPLHWATTLEPEPVAHWPGLDGWPGVRAPGADTALLLQLGEILERDRLFVRDVVDIRVLLEAAGGAPPPRTLRALGLSTEPRRLARRSAALRRDHGLALPLPAPLLRKPLRMTLTHSFPLTCRRHGFRRATRTACQSVLRDAVRTPALSRPASRLARRMSVGALVEAGHHVQLVPVHPGAHAEVRWLGPRQDLLATPLGSFLAVPPSTRPRAARPPAR